MTKWKGVRAEARQRLNCVAVAGLAGLALQAPAAGAEAPGAAETQIASAADVAAVSGETVNVTGRRTQQDSPKYTAPILDTPQTITIIDAGTIRGQNLLTLREILSTAPGITFGAGEGGGGYGDSINLRGYAANSDITIDGVRDSAQYTRTDPFNIAQIELVNGANSVYGGSGSLGGTINIVSKAPSGANTTTVTAAIGTDAYYRGTADADYTVADGVALRLNLMGHRNDVPGRDVEEYERWGFAPSITFGLGSPTSFTLSYVHQEDDNIPQYGVPYYLSAFNDGPLPDAGAGNYYGYRNIDRQEIAVDQVTGTILHDFNDWLTVRNLTRWQRVTQTSVVDPPQSAGICLPSGILVSSTAASNGAPCTYTGTFVPSGPRGNRRDTENELLYNQTDFSAEFMTGGIKHNAVLGFAFSSEDYHLATGPTLRNADGTFPNGATTTPGGYTFPPMSIADPDSLWTGPINYIVTGISDGSLDSRAVYLFDTMALSPQWEFNFGLRYEHVEGDFTAAALPAAGLAGNLPPWPNGRPALVQGPVFRSDDDLFSYRAGIVFKPVEDANIYFAYGNTQTSSQASVNGGCTAATCTVDPEEGEIFELGVKWNVLDDRLLLSASIFQNDRSNYKVPAVDPTLPPDQVLDGKARVRGLTLSATGSVTDALTVFANYTYLDSEVIQGVSDFCMTQPLTNAACYTATTPLPGNPLLATPEHSGSFWVTYAFRNHITVGYGATYQGKFYPQNTVTNLGGNPVAHLYAVDDYWVHSAMISYEPMESVLLQLNVKNVFDEEYYIRVRNNGWAVPGDARQATLSVSYTF
ncbi:MAG: TonB-dependent receptor [Alphaproteobacteria bacterium]|nr:TonB-dependent receptor [Alphaproteobacteria bacterium]